GCYGEAVRPPPVADQIQPAYRADCVAAVPPESGTSERDGSRREVDDAAAAPSLAGASGEGERRSRGCCQGYPQPARLATTQYQLSCHKAVRCNSELIGHSLRDLCYPVKIYSRMETSMTRIWLVAAGLGAAVLTIAACGSSSPSGTSTSGGAGSSGAPAASS